MADRLVRLRVPIGWVVGVGALYLAVPTTAMFWIGVVLAAFGEAIRVWASGHLEKNERLATSGPYGWTRNPLYFGSLFVGIGFAVATGRLFLVGAVLLLFLLVYVPVMRREASRLAADFSDAYPRYAAEVPLFWPRPPTGRREGAFAMWRVVKNREVWTALGCVAVAAILGWKLLN